MNIAQAGVEQLDKVAELFDAYRQFYKQPKDLDGATKFIAERLKKKESIVLLAETNGTPLGFVQLYPSFTSTGMARIFVLNDLFVAEQARGQGVATALMNQAASFAQQAGAARLELVTQKDNYSAQVLYEKLGWMKETSYFQYSLAKKT